MAGNREQRKMTTAARRFRGGDGRQVGDLKREIGRRDRLRDEKTEGFARSWRGKDVVGFKKTQLAALPNLAERERWAWVWYLVVKIFVVVGGGEGEEI